MDVIIRQSALSLGDQLRENVRGVQDGFPYEAHETDLDRYGRRVSWHWHDHFEVEVAVHGTLHVHTQSGLHVLRPGQAIFINASVLHMACSEEDAPGVRFHTQLFERTLIAGTELVERKYIRPLAGCSALDAQVLTPEHPRQRAIIERAEAAYAAAERDAPGHELAICAQLTDLWMLLFEEVKPLIDAGQHVSRTESTRVKTMISYIRAHYAEPITPKMIAAAAGVCERECFRSFKSVMGTTPLECLTEHRMNMAVRALLETDAPVTDIATACGFNTPSYFAKVFRQRMSASPSDYRRAQKNFYQGSKSLANGPSSTPLRQAAISSME